MIDSLLEASLSCPERDALVKAFVVRLQRQSFSGLQRGPVLVELTVETGSEVYRERNWRLSIKNPLSITFSALQGAAIPLIRK